MTSERQKQLIEKYRKGLEFPDPSQDSVDHAPRWLALQRAHDIRKFEIELYWKRATYFFLLQAAILTAIGFALPGSKSPGEPAFVVALGSLGYLCALSCHLAASGSRFWQRNWERHIDFLEREFEGNLYKAVWTDGLKAGWSVTRINEQLTWAFALMWLGLIAASLFWMWFASEGSHLTCRNIDPLLTLRLIVSLVCPLVTFGYHIKIAGLQSEISGDAIDLKDEGGFPDQLKVRGPR